MFKQFTGYIARETEVAIGFTEGEIRVGAKLFWIPRRKLNADFGVDGIMEIDAPSISIQIAGDQAQHSATPVKVEIETAFLVKVGVL